MPLDLATTNRFLGIIAMASLLEMAGAILDDVREITSLTRRLFTRLRRRESE